MGAAWNSKLMINIQAFSRRNLVSSSPSLRKRHTNDHLNSEAVIVANLIQRHEFEFSTLDSKISNGKDTYFFQDTSSKLVEGKINDNLKRSYNVGQNDRSVTVSQIKTLLSEGCPFYVLKLDIKEFFESINRTKLFNKICSNMTVSSETQWLLKKIDRTLSEQNIEGLPRGLSISSTLSEISLLDFDNFVRSIPGVYYYSRYVDDILIFCFYNNNEVLSKTEHALDILDGLKLNSQKTGEYSIGCICRSGCNCGKAPCKCRQKCKCTESDGQKRELQYLGYKFTFSDTPSGRKEKTVEIDIADKKIKKIKTRIALILKAYRKTGDLELTKKRLKFVTGNYPLYKGRLRVSLKGGIYYNYPMLNKEKGLEELDKFKRNITRSMKHPIGRALLLSLPKQDVDWISNISFRYGYRNKVFTKFSQKDLYEIKRCFES